ncbi:MAG: FAD-dependent oxidoreductase [Blautia sp.]
MENLIIVGAGPAGISAALYAARANLDPLVINNGIGALEKAEKIENYYGLPHPVTGKELFENGIAQAKALGVRVLDAQVLGVSGFDTFQVKTTEGDFESISVILATGSKRKKPGIPGLQEFEGKGVSYCAVCDAFFYRGKNVAVLGNSDFALHEAQTLLATAGSVTIYTDGMEPEFSTKPDLPVNTMKIQAIEGAKTVSGLRLEPEVSIQENGENVSSFAAADGIFVAMGTAGSSEMARQMGAALTEKGNIKVNDQMESTIPGLFAAGDCTGGLLQVAKAVADGAQAGISAGKYVRSRKK